MTIVLVYFKLYEDYYFFYSEKSIVLKQVNIMDKMTYVWWNGYNWWSMINGLIVTIFWSCYIIYVWLWLLDLIAAFFSVHHYSLTFLYPHFSLFANIIFIHRDLSGFSWNVCQCLDMYCFISTVWNCTYKPHHHLQGLFWDKNCLNYLPPEAP